MYAVATSACIFCPILIIFEIAEQIAPAFFYLVPLLYMC